MADDTILSVVNTPSDEILTVTEAEVLFLPKIADADVDFGVYGLTLNDLNISGQTASRIAGFDSSKNVISLDTTTYPSLAELAYVKGVTSAIQTQINAKANTSSLSIYWKNDGTSTATDDWDIGSYTFTADTLSADHIFGKTNGIEEIDLFNLHLQNSSGTAIDWATGYLIWGENTSVDWANRALYASDGTTAILRYDSTSGLYGGGGPSCFLDLINGKLISYSGTPYDSIDWINRVAYRPDGTTIAIDWSQNTYSFGVFINTLQTDNIFGATGSLVQFGSAGDNDIIARDIETTSVFKAGGVSGYTGDLNDSTSTKIADVVGGIITAVYF